MLEGHEPVTADASLSVSRSSKNSHFQCMTQKGGHPVSRAGVTIPSPFTVDSAATHLGVKPLTIYRWIRSGEIKARKTGGLWFIPASEIARVSGVEHAA